MTKDTESKTEAEMLDALLKARIEESFADPRPSIPHEEVVAALRAHHAARTKG